MCTVFPTVTSCDIPNVGAAGVAQIHNGLCVLTQVIGLVAEGTQNNYIMLSEHHQ